MIYVFVLNQTMEGCVVPYLKEVRLAGNLPGQLQGTYIRCCIFTCVRAILESTPRVECTKVTSLFRLVTSNVTLRGQLRHHQVIVHLQALHEFFAVRVVCVQWRMRVFLKFKSNCTVVITDLILCSTENCESSCLDVERARRSEELMRTLITTLTEREPQRSRTKLGVDSLMPSDNIGAFMITFERSMEAHEIPRAKWPSYLPRS